MKNIILGLVLGLSLQSFANDMSRMEDPQSVYKELADGTSQYIGKCSTHQNFENTLFQVSSILIPYTNRSFNQKISVLEKTLVREVKKELDLDNLRNIDDITVDKIISPRLKNLDLFRLNIGIGGGNGMYLVFNRILKSTGSEYELISKIMDGDVEYCDQKVWL